MSPVLALLLAASASATMPAARAIQLNENIRPAGRVDGNVLTIRLFADAGQWRPEGPEGAPLDVAAFGEEGGDLSVPGPLIRAREGTSVVLTLRNALESELRVSGVCARPSPCDTIVVPAGASREVRFTLNTPGTFYYWASSTVQTLTARPRPETQLGGAIVVDPPEGGPPDRIFVISIFDNGRPAGACGAPQEGAVFTINGASWPHTARLRYQAGNLVHWRVINLSCDQHAMHLHGFHFTVDSAGDGTVDRLLPSGQRRTAVTEPLLPGRTFTMSWTPARSGNWLFHCHMTAHMAAAADAHGGRADADAHDGHADAGAHAGMAGLVLGIEVTGPDTAQPSPAAAQRFSLVLREEPKRYGDRPGYRMDVEGIDAPRLDAGPVPGPVIVLHRGEPAEVTIVNQMTEPTAIHWHGIEIDSYYDGVPGYGGRTGNIAPAVAPGQSFVARLTPPRAGTFIYHTHWHDESQLAGGLYGPLLVLEPGETYDPATDHIVVIGLNGAVIKGQREPFALNGRAKPAPIPMRAGVPNRVRLINITPNNVGLNVLLLDRLDAAQWTPVAKDGATLPPEQTTAQVARQAVAVGETYDFAIRPVKGQFLWLEVRRANGEWVLQAPVDIR
jgi:FtsP/CotA-like multicopper oxidase with cupredoxin domain